LINPKNIISAPENLINIILFRLRNKPIEVVVRANNKKITENETIKISVFKTNADEELLPSFLSVER